MAKDELSLVDYYHENRYTAPSHPLHVGVGYVFYNIDLSIIFAADSFFSFLSCMLLWIKLY